MVGGQWLDLEAEGTTIAPADLEDIHARKTGALFAAALRIGALAAGAGPHAVAALGRAGAAFGLAFQVTDDLLDATGQREALGKAAGRDRALSKATFPELLGVDGARRRAARAAQEGQAALADAGIESEALTALIRFAAERDR
jgi:farnesyl diphosphate synthase